MIKKWLKQKNHLLCISNDYANSIKYIYLCYHVAMSILKVKRKFKVL